MRKSLLILILISAFTKAQEVELYQLTPNWSIGDTKTVYTQSESITYIQDSVFSHVKITGSYSIKVIDTIGVYSVKYSQHTDDLNLEINSMIDKASNFILELIQNIEKKLAYLEYIVSIDKETGFALEIQNSKDLDDKVIKMTLELIDEMGREKGKSAADIKSVKDKIEILLDSLTLQMNQTVINSVNYLMQSYSYGFPIEETYQQEITAYDINAMSAFGETEFPAIMTINSKESDDELVIYTSTEYEKEFLLEQMKKLSNNLNNIKTSDIFITEKEQITFDLNSTWIKEHVSSIEMKIPQVRVVENSIIQFK